MSLFSGDVQMGADAKRKLVIHKSNDESYDKKNQKTTEEVAQNNDIDTDAASSATLADVSANIAKLMAIVLEMKADNKKANEETQKMAKEAKDIANAADAKAQATKDGLTVHKQEIAKQFEDLKGLFTIPASSTRSSGPQFQPNSTAGTTTSAMSIEEEEKTRTLTFGNWAQGTDSRVIRNFITNHMKDTQDTLDEDGVFSYGRDTATRGAARFKTTELMLKYIRSPEMEWKLKQPDGKIIYINRDVEKPHEEVARNRQINKLIRAIIEFEADTDGEVTRKLLVPRRRRGIVEYKGVKVGQIIDGKMVLIGDAMKLQEKFDTLMGH